MLAPELAALLVVTASVFLFVLVLGSAHFGLTARTEHIARSIGARMLG
jgi:TRAP-type mannitol/chloroaromatic compound transport system permease large subunit